MGPKGLDTLYYLTLRGCRLTTDYYLKRGIQLGHAGGSEIQELVKPIGFKPVEKKSSGGPEWDLQPVLSWALIQYLVFRPPPKLTSSHASGSLLYAGAVYTQQWICRTAIDPRKSEFLQ